MDDPDELVTAREAAAILRRSVGTVHRLHTQGHLHPVTQLAGVRGPKLFARRDVELVASKIHHPAGILAAGPLTASSVGQDTTAQRLEDQADDRRGTVTPSTAPRRSHSNR